MATNKELLENNKKLREMLKTLSAAYVDEKEKNKRLQAKLSGAEQKAEEFKITITPYIDKSKVYEDIITIIRVIRQAIDDVDSTLLETQTRLEALLNNELNTEE